MSLDDRGPHARTVDLLTRWRAPGSTQEVLRRDYLRHLAAHPHALSRSGPAAHLTASCFVLDATAGRVLLTLHRKGGFWVQLGGHWEPGDPDLAATALREGQEESGIAALTLLDGPVDLHRHPLPATFGSCREHLDVAFAATVPTGAVPAASHESADVAWWPVDDLPDGVVADLPGRLPRVAALLATQSPSSAMPRSRAAETPSR